MVHQPPPQQQPPIITTTNDIISIESEFSALHHPNEKIDEQIEINETNYKLELLNFIAEHTLNDLDNRKYVDEAVRIYREEHYENS